MRHGFWSCCGSTITGDRKNRWLRKQPPVFCKSAGRIILPRCSILEEKGRGQTKMLYDLLILGGGCAGLTAGIYAGRAKRKAAILERGAAGGQAVLTNEIANYPGFAQITGVELAERLQEQAKAFGTAWMQTEVKRLQLHGDVKRIETADGVLESRAVILAMGAHPKQLGFPGEDTFRGRGISYCATCDGFFLNGKDIFVIGGGDSAAEEALYLTRFGKRVTVVVRRDAFRCAKSISERVLAHPKITVWFRTELVRAFGGAQLEGAVFRNNQTGEETTYTVSEADGRFGIFVFVGYQPDTALVQGQLPLDAGGYLVTNERMETGVPGVYAAGDIRQKTLRQLVTAAADGAIAATQAEAYLAKFLQD